jgi:NAD-dependent SIR2 family protein deacetylase
MFTINVDTTARDDTGQPQVATRVIYDGDCVAVSKFLINDLSMDDCKQRAKQFAIDYIKTHGYLARYYTQWARGNQISWTDDLYVQLPDLDNVPMTVIKDSKMNIDARMSIQTAAQRLRDADFLLICAGAGMSADSGIPTFRQKDGLWGDLPQLAHLPADRRGIDNLSNSRLFNTDPRVGWGFFGWRLQMVRDTAPHSGFGDLLSMANTFPDHFVFTSNVDGHFQKAGFADDKVQDIHGSLHWLQGMDGNGVWSADDFVPQIDLATMTHTGDLPRSPNNPSVMARPNIWMLRDDGFNRARVNQQDARRAHAMADRKRIAVISIGAGLDIPTVHNFALRQGGFLHIRINPDDAPVKSMMTHPTFCQISMGAKDGLKALSDAFFAV